MENEMKKQNQLDSDLTDKALQESNIDKMAKDVAASENPLPPPPAQNQAANKELEQSRKLLRLASIALLLKKMSAKNVGIILAKNSYFKPSCNYSASR